jgi:hypothetical protein
LPSAQHYSALSLPVTGSDLPWQGCLLTARFRETSLDIISAGRRSDDYPRRRSDRAALWDAKVGLLIGNPGEQTEGISTVKFSPNGKSVVTIGLDGAIRVFSVAEY